MLFFNESYVNASLIKGAGACASETKSEISYALGISTEMAVPPVGIEQVAIHHASA